MDKNKVLDKILDWIEENSDIDAKVARTALMEFIIGLKNQSSKDKKLNGGESR